VGLINDRRGSQLTLVKRVAGGGGLGRDHRHGCGEQHGCRLDESGMHLGNGPERKQVRYLYSEGEIGRIASQRSMAV
jgi:hypothetical protein